MRSEERSIHHVSTYVRSLRRQLTRPRRKGIHWVELMMWKSHPSNDHDTLLQGEERSQKKLYILILNGLTTSEHQISVELHPRICSILGSVIFAKEIPAENEGPRSCLRRSRTLFMTVNPLQCVPHVWWGGGGRGNVCFCVAYSNFKSSLPLFSSCSLPAPKAQPKIILGIYCSPDTRDEVYHLVIAKHINSKCLRRQNRNSCFLTLEDRKSDQNYTSRRRNDILPMTMRCCLLNTISSSFDGRGQERKRSRTYLKERGAARSPWKQLSNKSVYQVVKHHWLARRWCNILCRVLMS